jgi:hypothetical protein
VGLDFPLQRMRKHSIVEKDLGAAAELGLADVANVATLEVDLCWCRYQFADSVRSDRRGFARLLNLAAKDSYG